MGHLKMKKKIENWYFCINTERLSVSQSQIDVSATSLIRGVGGYHTNGFVGCVRPELQSWCGKRMFHGKQISQCQARSSENIPYFRPETLKNHIPLACTYLCLPYKAVPCSLARRAPSLVGARREKNCGPVAVGASSARSFARDGRQSCSSETS